MKNVFNISPVYPFLDVLGQYVLNTAKSQNLNIANDIILLPTRRACRALKEVFVRLCGGQVMLPKILPLGDVDEDGFAFLDYENDNIVVEELPPAIPDVERNLILSKLIREKNPTLNDEQAFALAVDLAHLMDTVEMEMLDFARLNEIVPENFSIYWQETLKFLQIITEWYPQILKERGYLNPIDRKIKLIYKQVEIWKKNPPTGRIFVAGSTGSLVPISYMITEISEMKNGYVILPHLDRILSDADFSNVGQNHPQYGLKKLLLKMKVKRRDVIDLTPNDKKADTNSREVLASYIMLNSDLAQTWQNMPDIDSDVLKGVSKITLKTDLDETLAISLCLKEMMEKGKKTLLITPDRKIAKSVASELKRWNIIVDDSAGISASEIDSGNYMILILNAIINKFSPFDMLSVLKHKFTHLGYKKEVLEGIVNNLEIEVLRGNFGLDTLEKIISKAEEAKIENSEIVITPILNLLSKLNEKAGVFDAIFKTEDAKAPLYDILTKHIKIVEEFVQNDKKEPDFVKNTLYNGDLESQLSSSLKDILSQLLKLKGDSFGIDRMDIKSYRDFISNYLFNLKLRPTVNSHPLIAIMNSIEARLLDADVFIMAGLNEQTFPSVTSDDPWMSRPMKGEFGLPLPERKIGLSSHDFSEFFCKPEVILTRAIKVDGNNTIESRWLQKLDAIKQIKNLTTFDDFAETILYWTANIDKGNSVAVKCKRPAPKPPVYARPNELWATSIEKLYRDPYIIFANKILKLKKLDDIDMKTIPADFGNIVHNSLAEFKEKKLSTYGELMAIIVRNAIPYKEIDIIDFWMKKFDDIAKWFIDYEASLENVGATYTEISGELKITPNFTLKAKADRIDILTNSGGAIVSDYKTGVAPSRKEVESGYAPQLLLEALILNNGGFNIKGKTKTSELRYLEISKGKTTEFVNENEFLDDLIQKTGETLFNIITKFEDENTPYISRPNPSKVGTAIEEYSEYTHLARVKEWSEN